MTPSTQKAQKKLIAIVATNLSLTLNLNTMKNTMQNYGLSLKVPNVGLRKSHFVIVV